ASPQVALESDWGATVAAEVTVFASQVALGCDWSATAVRLKPAVSVLSPFQVRSRRHPMPTVGASRAPPKRGRRTRRGETLAQFVRGRDEFGKQPIVVFLHGLRTPRDCAALRLGQNASFLRGHRDRVSQYLKDEVAIVQAVSGARSARAPTRAPRCR